MQMEQWTLGKPMQHSKIEVDQHHILQYKSVRNARVTLHTRYILYKLLKVWKYLTCILPIIHCIGIMLIKFLLLIFTMG